MTRFGAGFGVCLVWGSLLAGCNRGAVHVNAPSTPATAELTQYSSLSSDRTVSFADEAAPQPSSPENQAVPAAPPADPPAPSENSAVQTGTAAREMFEVEAHVALRVASVNDARRQLRTLTAARGATVTSDISEDGEGQRQASLIIRVPNGTSDAFMTDVERLGEVTARQITAKDVGKEYYDSEIQLHSLESTLTRYEQILQKAQTVEEILKIESELSRIRAEIERIKGELRYLGDRSARATLYVALSERPREIAEEPVKVAQFYPGVRAVALTELRSNRSTVSAFGGGAVLGTGRSWSAELDLLKRVNSRSGFDAVLATVGGETYSDFLGGGKRHFLNPYLGLRLGYARVSGSSWFAAGATAGVELWKNDYATIDCDLRALGLFGKDSELGLQPTLGASVAF